MLRSVVDELIDEPLGDVPDQVLQDDLIEITAVIDLEAQFLRRVAEVDRRGCGRSEGILSTTALLVHRCGMAASTAREKVRVARALESMPATRQAFGSGDLSYSKVRMLAAARDTDPVVFSDHEEGLVEAIVPLTVRDARVAVEHWRNAASPEAAVEGMEAMHEQRGLTVAQTFEGMVDPVDGAYLTAALDAVTSQTALADARASLTNPDVPHRSPGQRRMDALTEICRQWLANDTTHAGGERPHLDVTTDLDTLQNRAGHRAGRRCTIDHTAGTAVIDPESARMLACDAGVSRIITTGASMPLDVGRRTRTIPPAIRTALVTRDGGCRFPGCDRPPAWTDGHHITHWADGGPTSLDNLVLVCRRHHTLIHRRGFTVDHHLVFHRPDGTPIPERCSCRPCDRSEVPAHDAWCGPTHRWR